MNIVLPIGTLRTMDDELDALNAPPAFVPGTLALVTYPAGADISATRSTGGAAGTGVIDIRSLNLPTDGEVLIAFDITLVGARRLRLHECSAGQAAECDAALQRFQRCSCCNEEQRSTRLTMHGRVQEAIKPRVCQRARCASLQQ